jgi:KUP system potassium uptake protein
MWVGVVALVLGFGSSSSLAAAYGIAVNGDLIISSVLLMVVIVGMPGRRNMVEITALIVFLLVELTFLAANIGKIWDGGWFPLALGAAVFTVLTTWNQGVEALQARKRFQPEARADTIRVGLASAARIPRTGVFFSSRQEGYPSAFLHNLKHNMVVHQKAIFMTVEYVDSARVDDRERLDIERLAEGRWRVVARFGFREDANIATILAVAANRGLEVENDNASFFTSKADVVFLSKPKGLGLRRKLFAWMLQNSPSIADYLRLPPDRVVELRTQVAV